MEVAPPGYDALPLAEKAPVEASNSGVVDVAVVDQVVSCWDDGGYEGRRG